MKRDKELGSAHTGFHDWYWQRISAVILLLTLPVLFGVLMSVYLGKVDFLTLNLWVTHPVAKLFSIILLLTIVLHTWTGLKVIIEDYVHTTGGRVLVLNVVLFVMLMMALYGINHIWAELSYDFSCLVCSKGVM